MTVVRTAPRRTAILAVATATVLAGVLAGSVGVSSAGEPAGAKTAPSTTQGVIWR